MKAGRKKLSRVQQTRKKAWKDIEKIQRKVGRRMRGEAKTEAELDRILQQTRRKAAVARLERVMDRAAAKAEHIPSKKLDKLINEAVATVRGRKRVR